MQSISGLRIFLFTGLLFLVLLSIPSAGSGIDQGNTSEDKERIFTPPPEEGSPLLPDTTTDAIRDLVEMDEEFLDDTYDLKRLINDYDSHSLAVRAVQRQINIFTTRLRDHFSVWLSRAGMYIEMMKEILIKNGLPKELVFLPLIESGFNTNAYSRMRAVGPWQFIASTAKRYGLKITWWIDERRDPIKSTEAAARYLKELYEMFNSWPLALAAYNAGEGRVMKAMRKTKTDDHWGLLLETKKLRRETREYVPKFIAASLIALEPQKYGFDDFKYQKPINYTEVEIESPVDLKVIARAAETDLETIKALNPELKRWCTPPDEPTYTIRIPADKKDLFLKNLSEIPKNKRFSFKVHKIRRGETVSSIAKRYRLPVAAIYNLNPGIKKAGLRPGQEIKLPPDGFKPDPDDFIKKRKIKKARKRPSA